MVFVKSFDEYGELSGQDVDQLRSADEGDGKNHPADFALGKVQSQQNPLGRLPLTWSTRMAYRMFCMSNATLGADNIWWWLRLVFPHHENEVAQSNVPHPNNMAKCWMHNGLLTMSGGQKMGKSLGNVINIRDALLAIQQRPYVSICCKITIVPRCLGHSIA